MSSFYDILKRKMSINSALESNLCRVAAIAYFLHVVQDAQHSEEAIDCNYILQCLLDSRAVFQYCIASSFALLECAGPSQNTVSNVMVACSLGITRTDVDITFRD
jgi:hypothetical protein